MTIGLCMPAWTELQQRIAAKHAWGTHVPGLDLEDMHYQAFCMGAAAALHAVQERVRNDEPPEVAIKEVCAEIMAHQDIRRASR